MMADLLMSLARRALGTAPTLALRLPSRFEPGRNPSTEGPPPSLVGEPNRSAGEGLHTPGPTVERAPGMENEAPRHPPASDVREMPGPVIQHQDDPPRPTVGPSGNVQDHRRSPMRTPVDPVVIETGRSPVEVSAAQPSAPVYKDRLGFSDPPAEKAEVRDDRRPQPVIPVMVEESATEATPDVPADDVASLRDRLRPLLPPQPVTESPAQPVSGRASESRRRERHDPVKTPPAIEVTIGTIEVRAIAEMPMREPSTQGPTVSLDDYLKGREKGGS